MSDKVKISQEEFDKEFEIEKEDVQEEEQEEAFLTEEEQLLNEAYLKDYPIPKEETDGN